MNRLIALLICMVLVPSGVYAEKGSEPIGKEKKEELPAKGNLAGTLGGGAGSAALDLPWGGADQQGDSKAPISASVSKGSNNSWILRLYNNSEDKYSLSVEVVQMDLRNKEIKRDTFSYTLKGSGSAERDVKAHPSTAHCVVNLVNWKRFVKPANAEEIMAEIATKKKELAELEERLKGLGVGESE